MKIFKTSVFSIITILLLVLLVYLVQPVKDFPDAPENSLQSKEPADVESSLRRSYFLNQDRNEVITHYLSQTNYLPTIRLNYPPEDAQTIIRDQTRSSYLEEITQPFRLSVYINGFVPSVAKDRIIIDEVEFSQKITVRYIPTTLAERLTFFAFVTFSSYSLLFAIFSLWKRK